MASPPVETGPRVVPVPWDPTYYPVQGSSDGGGLPDAPADGNLYGRRDYTWQVVPEIPGPIGPMGPAGIQGDPGPTGSQGPQGIQGVPGTPGTQGVQGAQGIQGNTGPTGAVGPQGIQGVPGPQGIPGSGLRLLGHVATSSALPTTGNTEGDMWLALDTNHVWCWSGTQWNDVGVITGPAGPAGAQGVAGEAALAHTTAAFTVPPVGQSVGPVYVDQADWMVQNELLWVETAGGGANGAAFQLTQINGTALTLVNVTGSVGATVATGALVSPGGPQGAMGPQGPQGTGITYKGTVPTYSALPATGNTQGDMWIALDTSHGWIWNGTVWTDAGQMQGPPGPPGATGPQGIQGVQGNPGPQGVAGPAGPQGNPGQTGATGAQGPVGNTGPAGATGAQGPAGVQGPVGPTGNTGPQGNTGATGPQGVPGPTGPQGNPGVAGAQGPIGPSATVTTTAPFTVPPVGSTVTVTVTGDVSWLELGQMLNVQQAGGTGLSGALQLQSISGNTLTLLNPQPPPTIPLATSSQAGLLTQLSGSTGDFVDGTNHTQGLAAAVAALPHGPLAIKVFTASGTYTPTAGMKTCLIECVGGGAGGCGQNGTAGYYQIGAGGGAGAYARKLATAAQIGASQTVTIGAGGGGGAGGAVGGPGGDTSVGSLCVAKGAVAAGSVWGISVGGSGASSVGDFTLQGQYGPVGSQISSSAGLVAAGAGASSVYGAGAAQSMWSGSTATGGNAAGPGGGGGGGSIGIAGGVAGGNGGGGIVIITEFQ